MGAEGGYDSNVFLSEDPQDSPVLRIAPHLYLQTLGAERSGDAGPPPVEFKAGISGSLKHYFETDAGTNIGAGQDAKLTLRPGAIVTLELTEEFKRNIDPFTEPAAPLPSPDPSDPDEPVPPPPDGDLSFARDQLMLGARAQLGTPGGVFKAGLGYKFAIDHFEADEFAANRANSHTVQGDTSWEFFPKTALFWDGGVTRNNFINSTDELSLTEMAMEPSLRNDSTTMKTRLGLNGGLTARVGFTLAGGYGAGFFDAGDGFESVLAQAEVRWRPEETILWSLGYDRETTASYQGNFVRMDRIKTGTQLMLGGIVVIQGRVELAFLNFGEDPELGERDDKQFLASLSGEYRLVDWFAITAEANYWQNFTDFVYVTEVEGAPDLEDAAKYKRFEGWLGVRAFL